ncbi:unnamed protein product [Paramecium sonneborni]|uniref:EF-hand domain-containing protein n=1 Tax=Paramecium sonneborni TaxID=65129 RepID=A0A8S1LNM1_9CILI|nr:unnamed protein product [Paramecium sonneborni]
MGQIFQKHATQFDPSLIVKLKSITMRELFDCVDTIDKYYPQNCYLNLEQFDDIFATLTDNCIDLFNRLADQTGEDGKLSVHTFEALAAFAIFSGESFETKCMFVFRLFDFDLSNTLEEQEMVSTLQCAVRAMCKIAGLVIPTVSLLEKLGYVCFQMMDEDKNKHVDFDEFYEWTVQYDELQEFMLQYSGTQTYQYALKRMVNAMDESEQQFNKWLRECKAPQVPAIKLQQNLYAIYKGIDQLSIDTLFYMIIEYTLRSKSIGQEDTSQQQKDLWAWKADHKKNQHLLSNISVKKSDYLDIIRAWNVYSITDVNQLSIINIKDLKLLIWLYEDEEPDYFRINQEMQTIDTNHNNIIERCEWMQYLCSEESMQRRQTPQVLMKKVFDNYDEEQCGLIPIIYIDKLLRDTFKQQMKKMKDFKSIQSVNSLIQQLKVEFLKQVKKNNQSHFDWPSYYSFLVEATKTHSSLNKLLNLNRD